MTMVRRPRTTTTDRCAPERAELSRIADLVDDAESQLDLPDIPTALRRRLEAELPGLQRQLAGAQRRLSACVRAAAGGPARKAKVTKGPAKKAVAKKKKKVLAKKKKSAKKKR
jgi:hypothetical protein